MIRKYCFLLLLLSFIAKNSMAQKAVDSAKTEEKIYSIILGLREVKKLAKDNEHRKGHIVAVIKQRPGPKSKYYLVSVGFGNSNRYTAPVYNFYVKPNTYEVRYYGLASDSMITLSQWRVKEGRLR